MEALAILFVFIVALVVFVATWITTRNRSGASLVDELNQLHQYHEVLQRKALRAQLERWDDEMMNQIAYQLDEVEQRIARLSTQTSS